jgi:hypothetical protein
MMLVVAVSSVAAVVRAPSVVIASVVWRTPIIAVIAAWAIAIIARVTVIAVPICRVTESDSDWSDPD